MSAHISEQAAGLAALPANDSDRVSAYEHASGCPPCRQALHEAEQLLAHLDAAPQPEPPSDAAMRRAWSAVASEMEGAESAKPVDRRSRLAAALALAASVMLVAFDARGHALALAIGVECFLIELGTAAIAVGVAARIIQRGADVGRAPAFAALAGWSAVVAQVYLHFRCPVAHETPHLLAFHLGGVLLATLLGGPLGARLSHGRA
jgi:hypothetical protein